MKHTNTNSSNLFSGFFYCQVYNLVSVVCARARVIIEKKKIFCCTWRLCNEEFVIVHTHKRFCVLYYVIPSIKINLIL